MAQGCGPSRPSIGRGSQGTPRSSLRARSACPALHQPSAVRRIRAVREDGVVRDELEAASEARNEMGAEMEPAVIDAFVARIERRLADRADQEERALKR